MVFSRDNIVSKGALGLRVVGGSGGRLKTSSNLRAADDGAMTGCESCQLKADRWCDGDSRITEGAEGIFGLGGVMPCKIEDVSDEALETCSGSESLAWLSTLVRADAAADDVVADSGKADAEWEDARVRGFSRRASLNDDDDEEVDRAGGIDLPNE